MKGSKRYFVLGIVFVFVQVIFDMINPKVMGYTVDYIVGDIQGMPTLVLDFVDKLGGRDYVLSHLWMIAMIIFALYFMFRIHVLLSLSACFFILVVVVYSLIFHGKIGAQFVYAPV